MVHEISFPFLCEDGLKQTVVTTARAVSCALLPCGCVRNIRIRFHVPNSSQLVMQPLDTSISIWNYTKVGNTESSTVFYRSSRTGSRPIWLGHKRKRQASCSRYSDHRGTITRSLDLQVDRAGILNNLHKAKMNARLIFWDTDSGKNKEDESWRLAYVW